jgi:hypothetical protein
MSVSLPFLTTSVQLTAWQVVLHTALVQSVPPVQSLPSPHLPHVPPQSMSLSLPLRAPSVQPGVTQTLPVQTPLWQSVAPAQAPPDGHFGHAVPPQSTSVSPPFFTASEQLGV